MSHSLSRRPNAHTPTGIGYTHLKTTHSFIIYKHRRTATPPPRTYKHQNSILVTVSVSEDTFNFLDANVHSVVHL